MVSYEGVKDLGLRDRDPVGIMIGGDRVLLGFYSERDTDKSRFGIYGGSDELIDSARSYNYANIRLVCKLLYGPVIGGVAGVFLNRPELERARCATVGHHPGPDGDSTIDDDRGVCLPEAP